MKVRSGPTEEPTNIHEAAPSRIHRDSDVLARFCRTDLARTAQPFRQENVEKHNDEKCVVLVGVSIIDHQMLVLWKC